MDKLVGTLSAPSTLTGKLSAPDTLTGTLSISGSLYPNYDGSYEITPTASVQVLQTENKVTKHDFVINPIPSNYGLITWNGSVLTVS